VNHIIEVFNISNNLIGVAGAQCLAEALLHNKSLTHLNLFANKIDVDGARAFKNTLEKNCVLQWIDFGHNKLRDAGLSVLTRGIAENAYSAITFLGFRFNFITENGVLDFLANLSHN